jgi:hypothetical protein
VFLVSCDNTNSTQESSANNPNNSSINSSSNESKIADENSSPKAYTDIISEYQDVIRGDSDYNRLKNLADQQPENIRSYAQSYCEAKNKGFSDSDIDQHLEAQAEKISKSFSDSDTAKRLLRKAQNYSISIGKKYYCK